MAKRKGGEESEESYEFVPPDFDEDQFIHKEMVSFRTTSTLIVVGILAAVISWLLFPTVGEGMGWWVGILVAGAAFAALKPLYKALKFDISHYARREWLGTGFLMFFTWLAFFMILLNPPFSDHAAPTVDVFTSPNAVQEGGQLTIDLFVRDNAGIEAFTFEVNNGTATLAGKDDLTSLGNGHYRYVMTAPAGMLAVTATAEDAKGHSTAASKEVLVEPGLVTFDKPDVLTRTTIALVTVPDSLNVYAVYADGDGDVATRGDRVWFQHDEALGGWKATSNFAGWDEGENTFTLIVEERNRFEGQTLVPGGILRDGPHTMTVENPGDFKGGQPKRANPTVAPALEVPGVEVPLLIAGLVAVALVARRK